MTIDEKQNKIIEEMKDFDNMLDRYDYLIKQGNLIYESDAIRTEANEISGCQAKVWLQTHLSDGKVRIDADSEAKITKGIISLLLQVFDNQSPQDILEADLFFLEKTGIGTNLSPSRSNGVMAIIKQIRIAADEYRENAGN